MLAAPQIHLAGQQRRIAAGLRKELAMQMLRRRAVFARINVSPREIDQFLERQKKAPSAENEYNISHILIAVPQAATPEQLEESERKASEVYQKAADRAKLARIVRMVRFGGATGQDRWTPIMAVRPPSTGSTAPVM